MIAVLALVFVVASVTAQECAGDRCAASDFGEALAACVALGVDECAAPCTLAHTKAGAMWTLVRSQRNWRHVQSTHKTQTNTRHTYTHTTFICIREQKKKQANKRNRCILNF